MPLPRLKSAQLCTARSKRTKEPCKNPAAHGMKVCRLHGSRKSYTIKKGVDHPQYRHGKRTKAYEEESSKTIAELEALETLAYAMDYMLGPKTRGPKSKHYSQTLRNLYDEIHNLTQDSKRTPIN